MKKIKIVFEGFWAGFKEDDNTIIDLLRKHYEVQILHGKEKKCAEILFYSVFSDKYLDYDCVKVFYTGENICPDFNLCDYAIGFEHMEYEDRYLRFPFYFLKKYQNDYNHMVEERNISIENIGKKKFCGIVMSNGYNVDPFRAKFFEELSRYKQVDSGGKYRNNIGMPQGVPDKNEFLGNYKFSIAFENVSHSGYCTEKLMQAYAAGTVPIYWGDPRVSEYFNEKSFINCNRYEKIEDMIQAIRRVDEDDVLYMEMYQEIPVVSGETETDYWNRLEKFLISIVENGNQIRRNQFGSVAAYQKKEKISNTLYKVFYYNMFFRACRSLIRRFKLRISSK